MLEPAQRRFAWVLLGAGCLAASLVHLAAPVCPYDDAYIIYRYVENTLAGLGPVYNPGEKVFGVTCPLYALWLLALKWSLPGADLPALAVRGNLVFVIAGGLLATLLMRRLGRGSLPSALAGALVLTSPIVLRASIGGMESSMFAALLLGACLASAARRDGTAMLLSGLASLARPEGTLLIPVVAAVRWADRETRRLDHRVMAAGLLPLALWGAGATWYYGQPIPHSIVAKASGLYPQPPGTALMEMLVWVGRLPADGAATAARALGRLAGAGDAAKLPLPESLYRLAGAVFLAWLVWRWWSLSERGRSPRALALPAFLVMVFSFHALSNTLAMPWYIPLVCAPALVLTPAAGLATGASRWGLALRRGAIPILVLISVTASYAHQIRRTDSSLFAHGASSLQATARLTAYARAAAWIEEHSDPSESVAAPEIGVLGYRMRRRILDPCGLVSPEALAYLPVPLEQRGDQPGVISVEFVRGTHPDLVATLPVFAKLSLLSSEWFSGAYDLVHEEPGQPDDPRYRAVLIFRRRP